MTEHVTAVTVSIKDKLTLSLGVAVGSSIVRPCRILHPTRFDEIFVYEANCAICHSVRSSIAFMVQCLPTFYSFSVTLGWIIGKPLTLLFDPFESIVLFLSGTNLSYFILSGR